MKNRVTSRTKPKPTHWCPNGCGKCVTCQHKKSLPMRAKKWFCERCESLFRITEMIEVERMRETRYVREVTK